MKELNIIQTKLSVTKGKYNKFGDFNYRSIEDIFEALKPLLEETQCSFTFDDEVVVIGERYYIQSTGTFTNSKGESITRKTYAREPENRAKQDDAMCTGSSISYCHKYLLSNFFLISNGVDDPDSTHEFGKGDKKSEEKQSIANKPTAKTQVAQALQLKPTPSNDAGAENGKVDGKSTLNNNQPENGEVLIENVLTEIGNAQDGKELTAIYKKYKTSFKGEDNEKFVNAIKNSPVNPNRKQQ